MVAADEQDVLLLLREIRVVQSIQLQQILHFRYLLVGRLRVDEFVGLEEFLVWQELILALDHLHTVQELLRELLGLYVHSSELCLL